MLIRGVPPHLFPSTSRSSVVVSAGRIVAQSTSSLMIRRTSRTPLNTAVVCVANQDTVSSIHVDQVDDRSVHMNTLPRSRQNNLQELVYEEMERRRSNLLSGTSIFCSRNSQSLLRSTCIPLFRTLRAVRIDALTSLPHCFINRK